MKKIIAIALLFLLPQSAMAESFKDNNRAILRGLSPSTKHTIYYEQRVIVWKRFKADQCNTITLKRADTNGKLGSALNLEFRADDADKTLTQININQAQRDLKRASINWDSKDSTRLNYKCTNGEIGTNLDPHWLDVGSGIRIMYHGARGSQNQKMYITGLIGSNVYVRDLDANSLDAPRMRRTATSDRCGQLFIRHNAKYPASGLGSFYVKELPNGETRYFDYFNLSTVPTSTRCTAPYNIIP